MKPTSVASRVARGHIDKKIPVFALVERGGRVRSFTMPLVTSVNLKRAIHEHVEKSATLMTDEFIGYKKIGKAFVEHHTVNHSNKEYVRGTASTNTVEGYFSLLKRGLTGTYHHVSARHLHRYLDEFNFRYNARTVNDAIRNYGAIRATERGGGGWGVFPLTKYPILGSLFPVLHGGTLRGIEGTYQPPLRRCKGVENDPLYESGAYTTC